MRMFSVDSNNDIFVGRNGNLAISTELEACLQACEHAVKAQLGEMVLNFDQGVPNFQTVWQRSANIAQFEAYVRAAIMSVAGVIEVKDFAASVVNNKVEYRAVIRTIYGASAING